MEPVGFLASQPHYVDHLAPIWHALDPSERAWFSVTSRGAWKRAEAHGIEAIREQGLRLRRETTVVVAGMSDLRHIGARRAVFVEHGIGQTYSDGKMRGHYAGGPGRHKVCLFLCPNQRVADANLAAYPSTPTVVVGSPRLDRHAHTPARPRTVRPVVAVSFHFDARAVAPEARWTFPYYEPVLPQLHELDAAVYGHGHPRARGLLLSRWMKLGFEVLPEFEDVLDHADLYVCDNSSTLYEFAATGRPVVVLNAPWYRRHVEHGFRFWEHADVGPQVDTPEQLLPIVRGALHVDPAGHRARRAQITRALFGNLDGGASARAVEAMRRWL